jgi:predicted HTH domain antitoxin
LREAVGLGQVQAAMKTLDANAPPESLPAGIGWAEARLALAATFLERGRVTIAEGARLAGLSRREFVARMREAGADEALEDAADAESSRLVLEAVRGGAMETVPWSVAKARLDARGSAA